MIGQEPGIPELLHSPVLLVQEDQDDGLDFILEGTNQPCFPGVTCMLLSVFKMLPLPKIGPQLVHSLAKSGRAHIEFLG